MESFRHFLCLEAIGGYRSRVPDPYSTALDYRVRADGSGYPASVVKVQNGRAYACDSDGTVVAAAATSLAKCAPNNKIVIYELPTSWSRGGMESGSVEYRDVGTFQDVLANYVTSHDVEGFRKERLYNFLNNNGIWDTAPRIKLAFACLLTAVGVPMILAGEEFADQHDRATTHPDKQRDPVNFERMNDAWRRNIFDYVARLVQLRESAPALSVNDTNFIHADFSNGRRILAWVRGRPGIEDPIVVVANFSDAWWTGEYRVHNWPATPSGKHWVDFTDPSNLCNAPQNGAFNVPQLPWQAKVFGLAT